MTPRAQAAVEVIRSALQSLEGDPSEEMALTMLLKHIAARRPVSLHSLGEAFERNPTEPPPSEPPEPRG